MSSEQEKPDKPMHFLVVDDDPDSRSTIVEYLRSMGHQKITQARDGAEAIRMLDKEPGINFIISDWDMPMMTGLDFLQRVKSDPVRAHLPFLIVTAPISNESEKVVLAAESLVDAYLIKPFRIDLLKDKIEAVLETPVRGPQKQVVVIDDDKDAREMIVEYVKQMGFKDVQAVDNGKDGLDYLVFNAPKIGLILADWEMPGLTGIEVLQACKGNPNLAEIPFLMVTSQSSIERMKVMQAARAQVDQYLLKPFSHADMKKRVELLLEKARTRNETLRLIADAQEHQEHHRLIKAQQSFEEALKLDPSEDIALRGLGDVLLKMKGVEQALPYYKKAVEASPFNPKGYLKLATAYEQVGWMDKAIALLQNGIQQISFSAELHFHLGRLYNKRGQSAEAQAEFEKTLEIQLDHREARLMLEILHGRNKK